MGELTDVELVEMFEKEGLLEEEDETEMWWDWRLPKDDFKWV